MLLRYFFGNDIFISYAREDGKPYASKLKEQLKSMDYSCFIDYEKIYPGDHLSSALGRAIRRSRVFVLVGTKGVRAPDSWVPKEIAEFKTTRRTIVPININQALTAPTWDLVSDEERVWVDETSNESPSPIIFEEIKRLFGRNRRNVWVRSAMTIVAIILLTLSIVAILMSVRARANQVRAEENQRVAEENQRLAEQRTVELRSEQQKLQEQTEQLRETTLDLEKKNEDLKQKTIEADRSAKEAKRQEQIARQKAAEAKEQQTIAEQRQKVAFSRELAGNAISQLLPDPELSVILAAEAVKRSPETEQSGHALRRSLAESKVRASLREHQGPVSSAMFNQDGRLVITAGENGAARIWDLSTGHTTVLSVGNEKKVTAASFSPDGRYAVTVSEGGTGTVNGSHALVWEAPTWKSKIELDGSDNKVKSAAFSGDGKYLLALSGSALQVWDTKTWKSVDLANEGYFPLRDAAISRKGSFIAALGKGIDEASYLMKTVKLWSRKEQKLLASLRVIQGAARNILTKVAFSPDEDYIVATSSEGEVYIYQRVGENWKEAVNFKAHQGPITHVAFSPSGGAIITTGNDGAARIWSFTVVPPEIDDPAESATKSEDDAEMEDDEAAMESKADETASETAKPQAAVTAESAVEISVVLKRELKGHTRSVNYGEFSPDGQFIVTASGDKTARLWNRDGELLAEFRGHHLAVKSASFSADGKFVVTASDDWTARVWSNETVKGVAVTPRSIPRVYKFSFINKVSPDGAYRVTSAGNRWAAIINERTKQKIKTLEGHTRRIDVAEFSPDNKLLITGSDDNTARLWKTIDGEPVAPPLRGHMKPISGARFSPNGELVLTMSEDGTAQLWEVRSGLGLVVLNAHSGTISQAVFSPNGKFVVTASDDGTVQVWSVETGLVLANLERDFGTVDYMAFEPDNKTILLQRGWGGKDASSRAFSYDCKLCVSAQELLPLSKAQITRPLTSAEQRRFLHQ